MKPCKLKIFNHLTLRVDHGEKCDYVSGSLVIVDINNSQKQMTLKFTDLKMNNDQISYTFDGTIKLNFKL